MSSPLDQESVDPTVDPVTWTIAASDMGPCAAFMAKAISAQPSALANALRGRFSRAWPHRPLPRPPYLGREILRHRAPSVRRVRHRPPRVQGYRAPDRRFARIPVGSDCAAEFRSRNSPLFRTTRLCVNPSPSNNRRGRRWADTAGSRAARRRQDGSHEAERGFGVSRARIGRAPGIALDEPGETVTFSTSDFRPHRLSVRTGDSQSSKRGSIPRGGTTLSR